MTTVLVIGSVNMDVVAGAERMPSAGETMLVDDIRLVNGGKGANAAVAAARLGASVRFVGAVGDDAFGPALRAGLEAAGVDCSRLAAVAGSSGVAIVAVNRSSGQNTIMVAPGANFAFSLPADDGFLRGVDALTMQLETPLELVLEAARRARAAGVPLILDPAPAHRDLPDELLALSTVVSPNESELALMSGRDPDKEAPLERIEADARGLLARGAGAVAVKMGGRGGLWVTAAETFHATAPKVDVVDTTAAGDAFTGALTLGLARGRRMREVLPEAVAAGSLACTRAGAQPSLPTRAEVEAFMARG